MLNLELENQEQIFLGKKIYLIQNSSSGLSVGLKTQDRGYCTLSINIRTLKISLFFIVEKKEIRLLKACHLYDTHQSFFENSRIPVFLKCIRNSGIVEKTDTLYIKLGVFVDKYILLS